MAGAPSQAVTLATVASPLGNLLTAHLAGVLVALEFEDQATRLVAGLARRFPAHDVHEGHPDSVTRRCLEAYFDGATDRLRRVAVELHGTPFQRRVWHALGNIRPGETRSYSDLARCVGAPSAVRAVGRANALNPVSLVVPCHRVIGSDGSLTGYGGGLARKRWLLRHEGALP